MRSTILLALTTLLMPMRPSAAQDFSATQRQQIVGIVREALKADPSLLRDALMAMQADDVRRQESASRDVLAMLGSKLVDGADPVAGNPMGDVTVVEFYDTRCPYCRQMMPTTAELLRIDPNVQIVFKDMPILGPASQLESRALLAAQRQGGYFKLQAAIMANNGPPTRDTLRADADRLGLDGNIILRDMDDPAIKARLESNIALGQQIGLQGTPALIVGTHLIAGAAELGDVRRVIADARDGK